jgi:hypothetical protein
MSFVFFQLDLAIGRATAVTSRAGSGTLVGELGEPLQYRVHQRASQRLGRHFATQRRRLPGPARRAEKSGLRSCSAFLRNGPKASIGAGKSGLAR